MSLESWKSCRLVKSEDLNHHGTLFAGRCAEWFVESGFIAVAGQLDPKFVVCLRIYGLEFLHPVRAGAVLTFESRIAALGRSTLTVYVRSYENRTPERNFSDGFITFCYVDEQTRARPHGLTFEARTPEEEELNRRAVELIQAAKKRG